MIWQQISLDCARERVEAVSDCLTAVGALAVTYLDASAEPVYEPGPGEVLLWQRITVQGLFPATTDEAGLLADLARLLQRDEQPTGPAIRLDEGSWSNHGSRQLSPLNIGARLWVSRDNQTTCPAGRIALSLVPGLGFGTGDHPTTRLCLEWLEQIIEPDTTFIDYGCGSGILAIAALKLGAAHAWAVDIDPQALTATQENARRNETIDRLSVCDPSELPAVTADVLVANILCNPLLDLAPTLAPMVRKAGSIGLSGVLREQAEQIRAVYTHWFRLSPTQFREEWSLIAGDKAP